MSRCCFCCRGSEEKTFRNGIKNAKTSDQKSRLIAGYVYARRDKGQSIYLDNLDLRGVDFQDLPLYRERKTITKMTTDEDGNEVAIKKQKTIKVYFNNSDLTGAIFTDVDCRRADFKNATLEALSYGGANFTGARFDGTIFAEGFPSYDCSVEAWLSYS